ncbi:M20 metallopeptidase family protein [Sporolactobacillus putidus]|uniref:Peptidase n=1 Tax=Sporolactobacillus putidus TaxID=492735 RepID=A0A917S4F1_9BACL|nr:amidohydrolase [Sporolactobacillus putidus]GGL56875.1 peptidase [Sporolactobacillus putidus]
MTQIVENSVLAEAKNIQDWVEKYRMDFHRHPELSHEEFRTSKVVAEVLEKLGIEVHHVGPTGLVGILKGKFDGKVIALRADMDALPIHEQTGLPFTSENPGKMHACGHDNHISMLLGAARLLSEKKEQLHGTVKFLFQPAEEVAEGAKEMVNAGVLENPHVDYAFGMHIWSDVPVGQVVMPTGAFMASADLWKLKIKGQSSHGSAPWQGHDALVCAAAVVQNLQTIVSRVHDVRTPIVINIGTLKAGERFNVTPGIAEMDGMNRAFDANARKQIPKWMEKVIKNTCASYDCDYEFDYNFLCAATTNDEKLTPLAQKAVRKIVGDKNLVNWEKIMGSEDFSAYSEKVPTTFMLLGCRNEENGCCFSQHSEHYNADQRALPIGVSAFVQTTLDFLSE